ncbi:hypothetical protein AB0B07_09435 [Streptomyces sioyaensis]|uniref:hypothetical protein n=1 Tax=Streptomyces sioyaensis TaxID=67364 RepID=UPI0033DCB7F7
MSTDEQAGQAAGGSVPHAFRNALFWRWAPAMPKGIPASLVTVLYALGAAADTAGRLRFRDGKAIRIKDIAAAVKADEKDVRRYLTAAIAAGVVGIQGEARRGRATLYVLILSPRPDWTAAVASLGATKRKPRKAPPWVEDETRNGGVSPEPENGGHAPELPAHQPEEERGTRPPLSSGDTPPFGSGDTPPNNPGRAKELHQEMAGVGEQPQVVDAPEPQADLDQDHEHPTEHPADFGRCALCGYPLIHTPGRPTRTAHTLCERRAAERNAS